MGPGNVFYRGTSGAQRRFGGRDRFVSGEVVVVAAGTLGSTEILLRSREAGLPLSAQLGERFNGNGDVLGFAYDSNRSPTASAEAHTRRPPMLAHASLASSSTSSPANSPATGWSSRRVPPQASFGDCFRCCSCFRRYQEAMHRWRSECEWSFGPGASGTNADLPDHERRGHERNPPPQRSLRHRGLARGALREADSSKQCAAQLRLDAIEAEYAL
ncbi:MAG: hypothetical protein R2706_19815 [Acidimicrobiales bacterium]